MSLIKYFFLANAAFVGLAGLFLHFQPKTLSPLFHKGDMAPEAISVMQGWGSVLLAIAYMCVEMGTLLQSPAGKKTVCRGLAVGYLALAHGTYKMLLAGSKKGEWKMGPLVGLLALEALLFLLSLYFGVVHHEERKVERRD
eukprot:TRINITY_DN3145_c0_g1_i1.p1 TRINITY_DN3145_c0_g1~~TRINITY_DN3145_c0_g1_i1.p1  ORF type:complete len:156 (-),score=58.77 TRINITY_DN3145_c0_g1_i1:108-530(-)